MDTIDKDILRVLQKNARASLKEISQRVNLSQPSTSERLRKLEYAGYITGYTVLLDNHKLGKALTCFCMVVLKEPPRNSQTKFRTLIKEMPEIIECHCITGDYEYILKVVTDSTRTLEALLERLRNECGVVKTYTYTVLTTITNKPGVCI